MENNLMVFEEQQVEVFELNGIVYFNPYHVGNCLGLTESSIRMAICKMNKNQVSKLKNSDVKDIDIRKLNNAGENFLTESGVYKLAFKSNKPNAEKFSDWVTDEVLPSIRKTGFYSTEKVEQLKIQEPYKLVKKLYNGNPVMVLKDLEFLIGTSVHTIGYILKSNNQFTIGVDYFLLEGKELKNFKKNNNLSPWIGSLIVISKQGVYKLIDLLNLSEGIIRKIKEYFKIESPVSQSKAPILEQLQACKFIADDLKMGEAVKMSIYKMICEKNGIDTAAVNKLKTEYNKKLDKELLEIAIKYGELLLENFTTEGIIALKEETIAEEPIISGSKVVKKYMDNWFNTIIKISKKYEKAAI